MAEEGSISGNSRQRLTSTESAALEKFCSGVRQRLGDTLLEIRLFGSRARGEGGGEADLDVALVVTEHDPASRSDILELAKRIGLEHGTLLAPLILEQDLLAKLRNRERRLAAELDRDGVVL